MTYNPYSAVNAIYKLKGQWADADESGDNTRKKEAAKKAQEYYNDLRKNGYSDVADNLTASNYANAKSIRDKWAKSGRTATRPYLYSLGKAYGLSARDMDGLIGWDDSTGEVSFGGKKIGKPAAVVDGASYWDETTALDNAFNDYIGRSGTAASDSKMSSSNAAGVRDKVNDLWGIQKEDRSKYNSEYDKTSKMINEGMTESSDYKAAFDNIMPAYTLDAMRGKENEIATGAGNNAGNIDSFTAANALRQQAALTAKGQALAHQAGSEAWQAKIQNARGILSDLGVYQNDSQDSMRNTITLQQNEAQRLFDNDQTAANNDTARKSEQASVTGYTPAEWSIQNDAFLKNFIDENGKLKPEYYGMDFQDQINNAKAKGNTELANKYAILRGIKIFGDLSNYGKYLKSGDIDYIKPQRTESAREFDEQIAASDRALNAEQLSADADRRLTLDLAEKSYQNALGQNTLDQNAEAKANQESASSTPSSSSDSSDNAVTRGSNTSDTDVSVSNGNMSDEDLILRLKMLKNLKKAAEPSVVLSEFFRNKDISADRAVKIARQAGFTDDEIAEYDMSPYK